MPSRRIYYYKEVPGFDEVYNIIRENVNPNITREEFLEDQISLYHDDESSLVKIDIYDDVVEVPKIVDEDYQLVDFVIRDHKNPLIRVTLDRFQELGVRISVKHVCDTHSVVEFFGK
jgi:hypothetical protein